MHEELLDVPDMHGPEQADGQSVRPMRINATYGDRIGTLVDQLLDDGTVIPAGSIGHLIGWRGDELVVEWGDDPIVSGHIAPGEARRL